ncbi:MAG: hypothetical protein PF517_01880 [Salinivirgaceae bacterium]|jgi:antitoxin component YwqK of YwqJK toxin-antitoxin module|nr:hypothetical protein [Salinivirgaceae bacterium]
MRKNILYPFIGLLLLNIACNNQLKKDIVEIYDDGSPKKESFYKLTGDKKEVIKEIQFYENGQKEYVGHFIKGKKDGKWTYWNINGKKKSEGYFIKGIRTGEAQVFHENGKIFYKGEYIDGQKNGVWIFYNKQGKKVNEVTFKMGTIIIQKNDSTVADN